MENKLEFIFSDAVTKLNKDSLYDYINNLNLEEKRNFNNIVDELYMFKYNGRKDFKITNNSIKLCIKIFKNLNIKVFPHINVCTIRGYGTNGGTFTFYMRTLDDYFKTISSYTPVKECIKKKTILYEYWNGSERMMDTRLNK